MAKFCGVIGFVDTVETKPGVYEEIVTERKYYGDLVRNIRRLQAGDQLNDNVNVNNEISIIADPYAKQNFHAIRYAKFMGSNWKISSIEVQYPRLILTLGGLYNGQQD